MTEMNRLGNAVSPYLQQHRDNPVHWWEWSAEALAEAKRRDCPILLSVGYAACHWCHVMAHESFEDPDVAAVMNRLFVPIKVDREERPDIDHLYMTALHAMGEQGGWPMTMFLTPDGQPFWGGTYFPKMPRYGRAGFVQVMEAIDKAWRERRGELTSSAGAMTERLDAFLGGRAAPGELAADVIGPVAERLAELMDPVRGGIRGAAKFPNAPYQEILARSAFPNGPEPHRRAFLLTLRMLCEGGIYDHLGGGLHRYSTDDRWLVPHFEKMLYDNAQFLRHLLWGWRATGDDLFRIRIDETISWIEREMVVDGGGLAASLDADSLDEAGHSEEGAFYVWHETEIDVALGERAGPFKLAYDVTSAGNWEGKSILNRLTNSPSDGPHRFSDDRAKLLKIRAERHRPGRDDKVLADWNGLAIRALAEVAAATGNASALALAKNAFAFVERTLVVDGRLHHATRDGRTVGLALSADYGALILAAVALFQATLEARYLTVARAFADELERWHGDGEGGHMMTALDATDVILRPRGDQDEAVPGGTALVLEALILLGQASGDIVVGERAERAAALAAGRIAGGEAGHPAVVAALDRLQRGSELAIIGYRSNPGMSEMLSAANRTLDLNRLDLIARDAAALPEELPLAAMRPERLPAAFLCRARACRPPITSPETLATALAEGSL
ncbi:thioredoxin domain-containing protein [Mangrovicella endophytica]|uniref:thioredoxin domain-containing protein n=1 Tax=Mangrovicella endophytica TaxID=2066697 RepID=UPI000C9DBD03|nr:thioredoxin domain-containing protein [Mangrovicella endophytica]